MHGRSRSRHGGWGYGISVAAHLEVQCDISRRRHLFSCKLVGPFSLQCRRFHHHKRQQGRAEAAGREGSTHLLLAFTISPLTTQPFRDGSPFLLVAGTHLLQLGRSFRQNSTYENELRRKTERQSDNKGPTNDGCASSQERGGQHMKQDTCERNARTNTTSDVFGHASRLG